MKCKISKVVIFLVLIITMNLMAVPGTINFQGALKDADGMPVNDTRIIIFRIYDSAEDGTLLWSEQHNSVVISDGIFSQELGNDTTFPVDLFDNPELYITFFLGGEEMSPWQKILTVPYAIQSESIAGVDLDGLVQQDASGNAAIAGTMTADSFVGDGSGLTGISGNYDDLYVKKAGPDTISAFSMEPALTINYNGYEGSGLHVNSEGDGVYVHTAGYSMYNYPDFYANGFEVAGAESNGLYVGYAGNDGVRMYRVENTGVYVWHVGYPSTDAVSSEINGFEVAGVEGNGLFVGQADADGVKVYNTGNASTLFPSSLSNGFEVGGTEGCGLYVGQADVEGVKINKVGIPSASIISGETNGFEVAGVAGNGLLVGRADADGVKIHSAGSDGVFVQSASGDGFKVDSAGSPSTQTTSSENNGIEVAGAEGNGLYIGQADEDGVKINSVGNPSSSLISVETNGFEVAGAEGHGLYVGQADMDGVYVESAGDHGIRINSAGTRGVQIGTVGSPSTSNTNHLTNGIEVAGAGGNGLYIGHADYNGVIINSAGTRGVNVISTGNDGIQVWYASDDGVNANTEQASGEWGVYTPDKVYGSNVSSRSSSTHVRYVGNEIIETGDLVCIAGGYEENVLGEDDDLPVVHVTKANSSNSKAVLGVAEYKVHIREEVEEFEDGKTETRKSFRYEAGSASYGDYLSIITFGPADVRVDNGESIRSGETLTAGNGFARKVKTTEVNGILLAESVGVLGKALEDSIGRGKIKVFVNCR